MFYVQIKFSSHLFDSYLVYSLYFITTWMLCGIHVKPLKSCVVTKHNDNDKKRFMEN